MSELNWGMISDGGMFESLMHAILYADDVGTMLFGRPGKDSGQDARSADGRTVYQAKYRQGLNMDAAVNLAHDELDKIKKYRTSDHVNYRHWQHANQWFLVANFSINPNDLSKWQEEVVPAFREEGLSAEYWDIEKIEGKLREYPHIRVGFFEGANRVLVGLKEAYTLLDSESMIESSYDQPICGRDTELIQIVDFAEEDKYRVLPIVGVGGVGKSRLLFESLMTLNDEGWRVYWALPETMSRSDRWFHLLNTNQPTCIAIDSPEDPGLLGAIIEQLIPVERQNWKVIFTCRSEKSSILRRYHNNKLIAPVLNLGPLDEDNSKKFLQAYTTISVDDAWRHSVFKYTGGVPGWLALVADLTNRKLLTALPSNSDVIGDAYVNGCLNALSPEWRAKSEKLIKWVALWGALRLETEQSDHRYIEFLNEQGIASSEVRGLLQDLVDTGLMSNWGVGKRVYAVRPAIIREHIISKWLLEENQGDYEVSQEGHELIGMLVKGEAPAPEDILKNLANLSRSRLREVEGFSLFEPFYKALEELAISGNVLDQTGLLKLIESAGPPDPERALDIVSAIRSNQKPDMQVDVPLWGPRTYTHANLLTKLPWVLYQIGESVANETVSFRYLKEFGELAIIEEKTEEPIAQGKNTEDLVKRLICESRNSILFARSARLIVDQQFETPGQLPFVGLLIELLLRPERESLHWVANWKMAISRWAIIPGQEEWDIASHIRQKMIDGLKTSTDHSLRTRLWNALSKSHRAFHRTVMHGHFAGEVATAYHELLIDDLIQVLSIFETPPTQIDTAEATAARRVWEWYLDYGKENDPVDLAHKCEAAYNSLSQWPLHRFFRFDDDEALKPVTNEIATLLKEVEDVSTFEQFFEEVDEYLTAARNGGHDGADAHRLMVLADELFELFDLDANGNDNPLTTYVKSVLLKGRVDHSGYEWHFVVCICKSCLKHCKGAEQEGNIKSNLTKIVNLTTTKTAFLSELYWFAHPKIIGELTEGELEIVLSEKDSFDGNDLFSILGTFAVQYFSKVKIYLSDVLNENSNRPDNSSTFLECFIRSMYLSCLRYEAQPHKDSVSWIISKIQTCDLNGKILGMHELSWIRDKSDSKLSMSDMFELISSRIKLEKIGDHNSSFDILPYNYSIEDWCFFNTKQGSEIDAFYNFCKLIYEPGFTSSYRIPKFVVKLDTTGEHVAGFVKHYLDSTPDASSDDLAALATLASGYSDASVSWARVAEPICQKIVGLGRQERERIYYYLSKKETGVISSTPGEPANYYFQVRDEAKGLLANESGSSPIREYREWALRRAESDLRLEQERAEEVAND